MIQNISIIIFSIFLSSFAHLSLKKGVSQVELFSLADLDISQFLKIAFNPWIFSGMLLHIAALVVWLWALSRVDISFAYPFLALGYVIVGIMAWLWLGESITLARIMGMLLIIAGLAVISQGS